MDLGILRESALVSPLKSARHLRMTYSLFDPRALLPAAQPTDYRRLLGLLPLDVCIPSVQMIHLWPNPATPSLMLLENRGSGTFRRVRT